MILLGSGGCNGGIPPTLVDSLLGHGCLDLLVEVAGERGDWFCAQGAVRGLCAAGEFERAWAVIEPFVATGWQPAVRAGADVLLWWGRTAQALEPAHPRSQEKNTYEAWRDYAEVLVEAGRVGEAIDALAHRLHDGWTLWALVEVTEGRGRDERVLELLAPIAEELRHDSEHPRAGLQVAAKFEALAPLQDPDQRLMVRHAPDEGSRGSQRPATSRPSGAARTGAVRTRPGVRQAGRPAHSAGVRCAQGGPLALSGEAEEEILASVRALSAVRRTCPELLIFFLSRGRVIPRQASAVLPEHVLLSVGRVRATRAWRSTSDGVRYLLRYRTPSALRPCQGEEARSAVRRGYSPAPATEVTAPAW